MLQSANFIFFYRKEGIKKTKKMNYTENLQTFGGFDRVSVGSLAEPVAQVSEYFFQLNRSR